MKSSYRDLLVWQKAMDLVDRVYATVRTFPKNEMFVLSAQMRRAVISVPCNIAEGQGRSSLRDFRHFLHAARASALELETEILIALRQEYVTPEAGELLVTECVGVSQMINGLIRHLSKRIRDE